MFRVHRKKYTRSSIPVAMLFTRVLPALFSCLGANEVVGAGEVRKVSQKQRCQWVSWPGLRGLLIWKALESRYLKRTTTKDALRNILDSLSLRIIKAVRFSLWE